ncbi:MAG: glycogen/starch synthase [Patescibacteria group bacterium]
MSKQKLKILMVSAEVAPFAKVGGLADIVGSLPLALKKLGCEVRIVMPMYGSINKKKYKIIKIYSNIEILSAGKKVKINLWQAKLNKEVTVYFIDCHRYFGRKEVYFGNNSERFLFFSLASLKVLPIIKFKPDIIHCHDFHTALIPNLLKINKDAKFCASTLYTIHNLNYQGKSEIEVLSTGNLNKKSLPSLSQDARDGDINFMAQGIINADLVNTVSPTYAKEITTSVYGARLERVIRANKNKISGILNGIDINLFNPATDKFIKENYNLKTLEKKVTNKLALQKKLGLPASKEIPLVGFISRLVWQKGVELFDESLLKLDCQFVILGTGQREYEILLKKLEKKYPEKISANIMFDIKLAQQIYAGADIFLMPSRFEPCGLGQMIAMRYGAVPVVRSTGGLVDTVDTKAGFRFKNFESKALKRILDQALEIYYNKPKKWKTMQANGMKKDFSWNKSAKEYLKLYKKLAKRNQELGSRK